MALRLFILCLFNIFIFTSCKDNANKHFTQLIKEWQGKKIAFPDNPIFITLTSDTVNFQTNKSEYKILIYVDSAGCTSCKLQLDDWKQFLHHIDSVIDGTIPFLCFIHAKNLRDIQYLLKQSSFEYPICFDSKDSLNKLNKFPSHPLFQTFLLNTKNEVEIIGNPIHNPNLKNLYLSKILKETNNNIKLTTANIQSQVIDLGVIKINEIKEVVFTLENTGQNPLIIIGVGTSCGCVLPFFEKDPISPKEKQQIRAKVQIKEKGYFNKTMSVKCNIKNLITLTIKGQAI